MSKKKKSKHNLKNGVELKIFVNGTPVNEQSDIEIDYLDNTIVVKNDSDHFVTFKVVGKAKI